MKWVLGIGNPGEEYAQTRHNLGFWVVDQVAAALGVPFVKTHSAMLEAKLRAPSAGEDDEPSAHYLLKPQAYVNRSGEALVGWFVERGLEAIDPQDLLVVVDDLALDPGVSRLKAKGSAGGHNGLKSLITCLGTEDFPRLKVGIGGVPASEWREHVLSPFGNEERKQVELACDRAALGVRGWLLGEPFLELQHQVNRTASDNLEGGPDEEPRSVPDN